MTSENAPENVEETEVSRATGEVGSPQEVAGAGEGLGSDASQSSDATESSDSVQPTALFVRRERRMNLGGWVVLALVVGALTGLVWGMFRGVFEIAPLLIAALYGVIFVGVGLALVAVIVDWVLERRRVKQK